jgi:hypothetical membrane protein
MRRYLIRLTLLALVAPAAGALSATLAYRGKHGEPYAAMHQFVSQLGEVGVSANARVFNASLILAGMALAAFALGLGILLRSRWSHIGAVLGAPAGLACAMVGVLPMNEPRIHNLAASCCFNCLLTMIASFSLAIWEDEQRTLPRWLVIPGVLTMVSLAFLASLRHFLPVLEWTVVFTMLTWLALTTAALSRESNVLIRAAGRTKRSSWSFCAHPVFPDGLWILGKRMTGSRRKVRCNMLDQCFAIVGNLGAPLTIVLALLALLFASCLTR